MPACSMIAVGDISMQLPATQFHEGWRLVQLTACCQSDVDATAVAAHHMCEGLGLHHKGNLLYNLRWHIARPVALQQTVAD